VGVRNLVVKRERKRLYGLIAMGFISFGGLHQQRGLCVQQGAGQPPAATASW
jgi:hypothetical protein